MTRNDGRKSVFAPLGLLLLCAHCSLGALVAALGAFGFLSLTLFGVRLDFVLPPVLFLGGFAWYLWGGRRARACALPDVSSDPRTSDSADSG